MSPTTKALLVLFLVQILFFEFMLFACNKKSTGFKIGFGIFGLAICSIPIFITFYYFFGPVVGRSKATFIYELLAIISPFVIIYTLIPGLIFDQQCERPNVWQAMQLQPF
ncbi:MAG: hypothetical protein COC24_000590 [Alphaproteobacteria bacterium]|nr:hypothetical protein [Alphaproteobacteria bacterium]